MVSPRKSRKKSLCFSKTWTSTPARARRNPSITPAGPPPTMQQRVEMVSDAKRRPSGNVWESSGICGRTPRQATLRHKPVLARKTIRSGCAVLLRIFCGRNKRAGAHVQVALGKGNLDFVFAECAFERKIKYAAKIPGVRRHINRPYGEFEIEGAVAKSQKQQAGPGLFKHGVVCPGDIEHN